MAGKLDSVELASVTKEQPKIELRAEKPGSTTTVLVEDAYGLVNAVSDLGRYKQVAFDCEGVNLGRKKGSLSIATISGSNAEASVYVVDVLKLGGERAFSKEEPSLRSVLEDAAIRKVMFDCRTDSDALKHQFDVTLSGALDLQVLDQAVRIQGGEAPPTKSLILTKDHRPHLQSMAAVLERYPGCEVKKCEKNETMMAEWNIRPLPTTAIEYATTDVKVIKDLLVEMHKKSLSKTLTAAADDHSKLREDEFREREETNPLKRLISNRSEFMLEHPIISETALPAHHPRREAPLKGHAGEKWNETINILKCPSSPSPQAFNLTQFILQHDDWYTPHARQVLQSLCKSYPFTMKQRGKIAFPPPLQREEEEGCGDY